MNLPMSAIPLLAVAIAILGLRRPPVQAAAIGAGVAGVLFFFRVRPTAGETMEVMLGAVVLTGSAAAVIVPGLLFVEITRNRGAGAALGDWVRDLPASAGLKAVLLVVGLAPFLESLTGFGVCLVAVVPAALALLPRDAGLRVALVGMNVMPWGTLGLATIVGAQLAAVPVPVLGTATALTSGLVFPAASILAAVVAGSRSPGMLVAAGALGAVFSAALFVMNQSLGVEIAGVFAGLTVVVAVACWFAARGALPRRWPTAAWPYLALFGFVLVLRLVLTAWPELTALTIRGGGKTWAPLTTPGIALALTAALVAAGQPVRQPIRAALHRAVKPVGAVGLFLLMSQLMVATGLVRALASALHGLDGTLALGLVAGLGTLSGYMTGSNIGGNALLMEPAAALGDAQGVGLLFAAVQNSAAGHAVLASVPIVALLASLSDASTAEQSQLLRFGLAVAIMNAGLIVVAAASLKHLGAL